MKNEFTIYCIRYGKAPNVFLAIADNNIPFKIVGGDLDVLNSIVFENDLKAEIVNEVKKICKDTGKTAILNKNHPNSDILKIINIIIGSKVIWKEITFKAWNNFTTNIISYCGNDKVIEIDHPINLKDKEIINILEEGKAIAQKEKAEWEAQYPQLKKFKRKKKNGN